MTPCKTPLRLFRADCALRERSERFRCPFLPKWRRAVAEERSSRFPSLWLRMAAALHSLRYAERYADRPRATHREYLACWLPQHRALGRKRGTSQELTWPLGRFQAWCYLPSPQSQAYLRREFPT